MDFDAILGTTFREVDHSERNGSPTNIVRASRDYTTTPADLWNAVTERKRIQRWFANVTGDFKQGGRFSIEGNADGDIVVCDPPKLLSLTWEFGDNVSWVTVIIEKSKEGALLTVEHEHPTDDESQAHWAQYGPGATGVGWELALFGLGMHLQSNGTSTIDAGMKWAEGSNGKAAMRAWAKAWGTAHAAAGADAHAAKTAAEATAKFYTGASE